MTFDEVIEVWLNNPDSDIIEPLLERYYNKKKEANDLNKKTKTRI